MISQNKNEYILSGSGGIYRRLAKYLILVLLPAIILNFTTTSMADHALNKTIPFQLEEKLTYKAKWEGTIPAGELSLEVLPKKTINGIEVYHFVMITKTNPTVDLIYKIRDRQDSYVDSSMNNSIFFKKKTEGKHLRDVSINFNLEKHEATYTNFGQKKAPINISPGTFDPLAFFYIIRFQNLNENAVIYLPLTDGRRNIEVRAIVGKRDIIEIEGKTYNTIEITSNIKMLDTLNKEVTKKSDYLHLKVWVTTDEKRIPVKIRSKTGIISFDFDLVSSTF